jgi:hypothetical protein
MFLDPGDHFLQKKGKDVLTLQISLINWKNKSFLMNEDRRYGIPWGVA